jgi:hypothetical protein
MTEVTTIERHESPYHPAADWTGEQKIVLACRMLAADGHDSVLPGLMSWRAGPISS